MKKYIKCDLCNSEESVVIEAMGRDREPATYVVCCKCGLVYQNPRMDSEEMRKFYNVNFAKEKYKITEEWASVVDKHRHTYIHTYIHTKPPSECIRDWGWLRRSFKTFKRGWTFCKRC